MTEWPKNPQLRVGGEIEPSGPVNVFNEVLAVADAINRATEVKKEYEVTHPPVTPTTPEPPPPGTPIDPGSPVVLGDLSLYMIDTSAAGGRRRR